MNPATTALLPVVATAAAIAFSMRLVLPHAKNPLPAWPLARRVATIVLLANAVASVLFGAYIATQVACCSGEKAMWVMPLIFAPVEYWKAFGIPVAMCAIAAASFTFIRSKR